MQLHLNTPAKAHHHHQPVHHPLSSFCLHLPASYQTLLASCCNLTSTSPPLSKPSLSLLTSCSAPYPQSPSPPIPPPYPAALISIVLHLDKHLSALIQSHGQATYALLWAIVFCETGLVLTPFLPGDSLLFAAGAFAGMGQLDLRLLFAVFMSSAVLGDAVNYAIGARLGERGAVGLGWGWGWGGLV